MKTSTTSKTNFFDNSSFEMLTDNEMNNVQGGARWYLIVDENGNYRVVFVP